MACANLIFDSVLSSRPGMGQAAGYFLPCGCWGWEWRRRRTIWRKSKADGNLLHVFFFFPDSWSDAFTMFSGPYQAAANLAADPEFEIISRPGLDMKIAAYPFLILCVTYC